MVYGCWGLVRTFWVLPVSTIQPAYMTAMFSQLDATVEISWVIIMRVRLNFFWMAAISLRIWPSVTTSKAVVASSIMSILGLCSRLTAMEIRCIIPPESSWGYRLNTRSDRLTTSSNSKMRARTSASEALGSWIR